MTIQVHSVLTTLDGRESTCQIRDTIISPDLTAAIPVHHPFAHSYLYSCIMSLGKTHFVPELIHKLSTLYFTKLVAMGGSIIRNEPATTALLEQYPVAYQIFEQAGWLNYFYRLQWYIEQQVLQFAQNLQEDHSVVAGVRISVTEEDIAEVSGLPRDDTRVFSRKHIIKDVQQSFYLPEERIVLKGRGVQLSSLPPPWPRSHQIHQALPDLRRSLSGSLSARFPFAFPFKA
jgi:hypothetical protein